MSKNKYPFPYIGAGNAEYYEWAEVMVCFKETPSKEAIEQIISLTPVPIRPELDITEQCMFLAGSNQFVNLYIEETYGGDEELDIDNMDLPMEFYCSDKALQAFNQDIERWLLEIHTICPVLCAYRPEDWEAGGTQLSEWHEWSVALKTDTDFMNQLEVKASEIINRNDEDEIDSFQYLIENILAYWETDKSTLSENLQKVIQITNQDNDED